MSPAVLGGARSAVLVLAIDPVIIVEAGGDGRDDNINKTASWLDPKGGMTDARGPFQGGIHMEYVGCPLSIFLVK